MMKFFALVALALVATSNASTVAAVTANRASVVAGAAGGNLVLEVTASATGAIAHTTGTITATLTGGNIFTAAGATACTATVAGVDAANAPAFVNAGTADKCVVSAESATGATLTCTMGGTNDDILANNGVMTITCTDNLVANNQPTAIAYTFSVVTSGDDTAATGSYTLKTTANTFTASRPTVTGNTNLMVGMAGGALTFTFTPVTTLPADGTITLTPLDAADANLDFFTASSAATDQTGATTCTATVADATTAPTFASAIVSGASGAQILTLTLNSASTDTVLATKAATIVCTDNLAVNTAAGAIKFNLVTSSDTNAMGPQDGYNVIDRDCPLWTSAARATLTTGVAGGDLTVIFTTTKGPLAIGETITLTPSVKLFTNDDDSTTCTVAVNGGNTAPTVTTAVTGTGTVLTLTTVGQAVAAGTQVTLVCSTNLDVNTAVGDVTFSIATTQDATTLAAQTGYTITAATSAASSTASVSMLTMLALAAVAMRQ